MQDVSKRSESLKGAGDKLPLLPSALRDCFPLGPHKTYANRLHLKSAIAWICMAQDVTSDGGVSAGYSLKNGWLSSYPETTGYIIPTVLDYYQLSHEPHLRERAVKMADFLLDVQNPDGSVFGGEVGFSQEKMVFDTGQIIFGLTRAFQETGNEAYRSAAKRAGDWLISVQDRDGVWRKHEYKDTLHVYNTRVAWALLSLHAITLADEYRDAAYRNLRWALTCQLPSGWFANASFVPHEDPVTHTIAYTIEGILEAAIYLHDHEFLTAAKTSADAMLRCLADRDHFAGAYDSDWNRTARYCCLTGNAQMSVILFRLHSIVRVSSYLEAALRLNCYLRQRQFIGVNRNLNGAIPGSYPIYGGYMPFSFPNWATKFLADALMLEDKVLSS